jgi:hypothetical protein
LHALDAQHDSSIKEQCQRAFSAPLHSTGTAFGAEPWAVDVFAEEVVRGGPAFAVSLVLSSIDPTLRSAAAIGAWQARHHGEGSRHGLEVEGSMACYRRCCP